MPTCAVTDDGAHGDPVLPGNAQQKLMDTVFGAPAENKYWKMVRPYGRAAVTAMAAIITLVAVWFILTHK